MDNTEEKNVDMQALADVEEVSGAAENAVEPIQADPEIKSAADQISQIQKQNKKANKVVIALLVIVLVGILISLAAKSILVIPW